MDGTLHVKSCAEIVTDSSLLAELSVDGKPPLPGLRIRVEKAFLHCGLALLRARLWDPSAQIDRPEYPKLLWPGVSRPD